MVSMELMDGFGLGIIKETKAKIRERLPRGRQAERYAQPPWHNTKAERRIKGV